MSSMRVTFPAGLSLPRLKVTFSLFSLYKWSVCVNVKLNYVKCSYSAAFSPIWGYADSVHQSALISYLCNAVKNENEHMEHKRYICPRRGEMSCLTRWQSLHWDLAMFPQNNGCWEHLARLTALTDHTGNSSCAERKWEWQQSAQLFPAGMKSDVTLHPTQCDDVCLTL